jgi:hypothetical protein
LASSYLDPTTIQTYGWISFDTPTTGSIPEPASMLLLGIGLAELAGLRRKMK